MTDLTLPPGKVMIECNEEQNKIGSLYVPVTNAPAYPTSGWVVSVGKDVHELNIGDFVLLEEHGNLVEETYYDVFEISLRMPDGSVETIWSDLEAEPVLREFVYKYRRGFGDDVVMSLADRKVGGSISFNCSDVLSWQPGQLANPRVDLTYVPAYMFVLLDEDEHPRMYYITTPSNILATVEY